MSTSHRAQRSNKNITRDETPMSLQIITVRGAWCSSQGQVAATVQAAPTPGPAVLLS